MVSLDRPLGGQATPTPHDQAVDQAARQDLARHHGQPNLGPITVVIPAYNEANNVAAVLRRIPPEVCGQPTAALVVVDGATDNTAEVVRAAGAFAAECPTNRGQGAAFRLGYRLAEEHGADFVVTLDADGQYDPAEMERVLEPVLSGEADFVSGSRRLGANWTEDSVRRVGVRVFSALISLLCRHRVTDPSNGFRAMRSEVPLSFPLDEDQYQGSELLIATILQGYRVAERPVTMRRRVSGSSKKGNNLLYGYNFARVILKTWLREH